MKKKSMVFEALLCSVTVEFKETNIKGGFGYATCNKKAKHTVTYKDGATGKFITQNVCGIHLNSVKKYAERMKKKLNYDVELKIININAT